MRNLVRIISFAIFSIISTVSFAGADLANYTIHSGTSETVASIGLRFEFGDVVKTSVTGTVRRTQTDKSNNVSGVLADVAIPLNNDGSFNSTFRVMGLLGNTNTQGTAGLGFDLAKKLLILGFGVRGRNIEGGVNISSEGASPYIGVSTDGAVASRKSKQVFIYDD